jgi:hypothetical protein
MTTQTGTVTLHGPNRAYKMTATCTDDAWNELLDGVNGLHLFDVAKGQPFTGYVGNYAAGSGIFRIRNTQTNQIKCMGCIGVISKGLEILPLIRPFTVQENDVIECFTTVAGS